MAPKTGRASGGTAELLPASVKRPGTPLLALGLLFAALIAAAGWAVVCSFARFGGLMSLHGWIALVGGGVLTFALAGGLMWLVFHSARRGYDEAVHTPDEWDDPA